MKFRKKIIQSGHLGEEYSKVMADLHNKNAKILNNIIDTIGYPTVNKVGEEANEAAWLIIQHSIEQPTFMKKCAELLKVVVQENKADPKSLAYLTDRIAVYQGNLQIYGTQFDWDKDGEMKPYQYDDIIKVNQRRIALGLNTIEEQTEIMKERVKTENQLPPKDLEAREQKYNDWRKSVGWIS